MTVLNPNLFDYIIIKETVYNLQNNFFWTASKHSYKLTFFLSFHPSFFNTCPCLMSETLSPGPAEFLCAASRGAFASTFIACRALYRFASLPLNPSPVQPSIH